MKASRWIVIAVVPITILLAGGVTALRASSVGAQAEVAVGYGARTVCACRYLGNRDMKSCKTDFEQGMEMVRLSEDTDTRRITASVPLIAARSARFEPGYGCVLED